MKHFERNEFEPAERYCRMALAESENLDSKHLEHAETDAIRFYLCTSRMSQGNWSDIEGLLEPLLQKDLTTAEDEFVLAAHLIIAQLRLRDRDVVHADFHARTLLKRLITLQRDQLPIYQQTMALLVEISEVKGSLHVRDLQSQEAMNEQTTAQLGYNATPPWKLKQIEIIGPHIASIAVAVFSPDCKFVGFAYDNGYVGTWNLASRTMQTIEGSRSQARAICFTPDGSALATAWEDGTLRIWNFAEQSQQMHNLTSKSYETWNCAAFTRDGRQLAVVSRGRRLEIWDVIAMRYLLSRILSGVVTAVAFSPDGVWLACADRGGLQVLKVSSRNKAWETSVALRPMMNVAYDPCGAWVAVMTDGGSVQLWNTRSKQIYEPFGTSDSDIRTREDTLEKPSPYLKDYWANSQPLAFFPDGKSLAVIQPSGLIDVWDTQTQSLLHTYDGHAGVPTKAIAFSPDGKLFVSGSENNGLQSWIMG